MPLCVSHMHAIGTENGKESDLDQNFHCLFGKDVNTGTIAWLAAGAKSLSTVNCQPIRSSVYLRSSSITPMGWWIKLIAVLEMIPWRHGEVDESWTH